jgi:hypothetical protein
MGGWVKRVDVDAEEEKLRLTDCSVNPLARWDARLGRKVA